MKLHFYALLCFSVLSICSCTSKKNTASIEDDDELRELAERKEVSDNDHLKALGGVDSLSLIAWGDTKFGMTKQEVKASEAFAMDEVDKSVGDFDFGSYYSIGPHKGTLIRRMYDLNYRPEIKAHFKNNELYLVSIESSECNADKIEDLSNDCGIFVKEFMKKYGEPAFLMNKVTLLDIDDHKITIAAFKIGDKEIWIGILQVNVSFKYYISISNKAFPHPTAAEIKHKKDNEIQERKIRDNSF